MNERYGERVERDSRTAINAGLGSHHDPMVRQRMGEMMGGSPVFSPSNWSGAPSDVLGGIILWMLIIAIAMVFVGNYVAYYLLAALVVFLMVGVPIIGLAFYGLAVGDLFTTLAHRALGSSGFYADLAVPIVAVLLLGALHFRLRRWRPYFLMNCVAWTAYLFGFLMIVYQWLFLRAGSHLALKFKGDGFYDMTPIAKSTFGLVLSTAVPFKMLMGAYPQRIVDAMMKPALMAIITVLAIFAFLFRRKIYNILKHRIAEQR